MILVNQKNFFPKQRCCIQTIAFCIQKKVSVSQKFFAVCLQESERRLEQLEAQARVRPTQVDAQVEVSVGVLQEKIDVFAEGAGRFVGRSHPSSAEASPSVDGRGIFSYTPEPHVAFCSIFVHTLFPVFEPHIQKWVIFVRHRPCVCDTFRFESPPLRGKKIEFGTDFVLLPSRGQRQLTFPMSRTTRGKNSRVRVF